MQKSLNEALSWRYATQQFNIEKKVSKEILDEILAAGNLMPTAYGLQPFQLVVIEDAALKESLVAHAYGQRHVADNSHLIVLAARTDIDEKFITEYTDRIESTRGLPSGSVDGYKAMMVGDLTNRTPEGRLAWAKEQAYIVLGGMMAAASLLEVDNHAMAGFDAGAFNEVLGLGKDNMHATVLLALGYRAESDDWQHYKKVRRDLSDVVVSK